MALSLDPLTIVSTVGIIGVTFLIFAESGLLIGFFLPGDSVLFAAGLLMSSGIIDFNVFLAVVLFFLAGTLGNAVGYIFGQKAGPRIFARKDARLFKKEYIESAQAFYERRGGLSIIMARFIPVVRTFAPIVAGAGSMPFRRFMTYNVIGGAIWTVGVTLLGYYLGAYLRHLGLTVDEIIYPFVALIIVISVLPAVIHLLSSKKRRDSFAAAVKRQFSSLFRKK